MPGLQAAFIFGSCARGDMCADSDIDVFAVGEGLEDRDPELALMAGTSNASMLLEREVNVTRYTVGKLNARRGTGFLRSLLSGPKAWLVGDERVLEPSTGGGA